MSNRHIPWTGRKIHPMKREFNEADDMNNDEAQYYAVQMHRYLFQKSKEAFSDFE